MMIDTQEAIALIRTRRQKQQDKIRFKLSSGMPEDAAVNTAIVAEYDALLDEIEHQSNTKNRFSSYQYNADQSRRSVA